MREGQSCGGHTCEEGRERQWERIKLGGWGFKNGVNVVVGVWRGERERT